MNLRNRDSEGKGTNTGAAKLVACTGTVSGAACGSGLELLPGETKTAVATDLGAAGNQFLNVTNTDGSIAGQVKIAVL